MGFGVGVATRTHTQQRSIEIAPHTYISCVSIMKDSVYLSLGAVMMMPGVRGATLLRKVATPEGAGFGFRCCRCVTFGSYWYIRRQFLKQIFQTTFCWKLRPPGTPSSLSWLQLLQLHTATCAVCVKNVPTRGLTLLLSTTAVLLLVCVWCSLCCADLLPTAEHRERTIRT